MLLASAEFEPYAYGGGAVAAALEREEPTQLDLLTTSIANLVGGGWGGGGGGVGVGVGCVWVSSSSCWLAGAGGGGVGACHRWVTSDSC